MNNAMKLVNYPSKALVHGTVLRLPGQWPYEELVDFMVFDMPGGDRSNGLMVSSGHKAGLILVLLPQDSELKEVRGLSTQWVIDNWEKWIYPECNINDVHVIGSYIATPIE
ncbi:hypothetical protein ECA2119 [Pectobacterium atrosepticum SCRI1043]|uniref:Immunity protein 45 domain-containing protein n=1 Tax=Pectobacterium atrosepticum (strain SCRI 1043 / ATCC BAA-672) TaxID=218491 RepID=Q6D5C1_PECAS|nr:Imm45 family immunity protein [Pectobacterium atrosepticum]CAG75021.1 hypothetical protein ECA2119 [Pectobacterium atrosepticum SCRI1043]